MTQEQAVPRRERLPRPVVLRAVALAIVALGVGAVHFRPWTRGLLEDLQFAYLWDRDGGGGFVAAILPGLPGRPLHLLAATVGLWISDGGTFGLWLVMGLVAAAQVVAVVWALRQLVPSFAVRLGLAALLGLHPWWPAGDILRFMPAQVGVLVFVVWLGVVLRFVGRPRVVLGALILVLPIVAMTTYQAFAALYALTILVLLITSRGARRAVLVAGVIGAIGLVGTLAYSTFLVPALFPGAYESRLVGAGGGLSGALPTIAKTLVHYAGGVLILAAVIGAAVVIALIARRITLRHALVVVGLLAAAPFAGLIYAAEPLHLHDPERISLPIGGVLWLAAVFFASAVTWATVPARAVAAGMVAVAIAASIPAIVTWQRYADLQQELIAAVAPVAQDLPADQQILVIDHTGVYGDIYTLLPPALDFALYPLTDKYTHTDICTPADAPKLHDVAARFPIGTTPDCATFDVEALSTETETLSGGTIDIVVFPAPAP